MKPSVKSVSKINSNRADYMINEDIRKFSEFLDYYKQKYARPIRDISLPKQTGNPLVSSNYIMLDFDAMCRDANFYPKKDLNRPSTTDAIYYRIPNENNIELSLVEFKTFSFTWEHKLYYNSAVNKVKRRLHRCGQTTESQKGLDMLENIKDKLGNTIEFSLKLKPYDSLFVVLPKLYEEYCNKESIPKSERIDLYYLFKSDLCTIKLFIVGKRYRNDPTKAYNTKLGSTLEKQFKRLDFVNVLSYHPQRLCFENEFDWYANHLQLHEKDNLKSLNYNGTWILSIIQLKSDTPIKYL